MTGLLGMAGASSIGDIIFGTSAKAETNKILVNAMSSTKEEANSLYRTIDETTNGSLVSMQQLIPALSSFQAASGATGSTLQNEVVPGMANFGQYVYAMTGSTALAQTAMQDLSKGLNGSFASLDQYKLSETALMNTHLWSGKKDDVEGYMAAVNKVIGNTDGMMNTFTGMQALMGKTFSKAGKDLGAELLPAAKGVMGAFLGLNKATSGGLAQGLLAAGYSASMLASGLGAIGAAATGVQQLSNLFSIITSAITSSTIATTTQTVATDSLTLSEIANGASKAGLTTEEISSAIAHSGNTSALIAETGATEAQTIANTGLLASLTPIILPLLAIVAAVALVVAAFYEIGKTLGWWNDLGGMISAVGARFKELFSSIQNSQGIKNLTKAFQDAWKIMQPAIQSLQKSWTTLVNALNKSAGSSGIDWINMLGEAIGAIAGIAIGPIVGFAYVISSIVTVVAAVVSALIAFNNQTGIISGALAVLSAPIQGLYYALRTIYCIIMGCSPGVVPALRTLAGVFAAVLGGLVGLVRGFATRVVTGFNLIINGVKSLPGKVWTFFLQLLQRIAILSTQARARAIRVGLNILNGVVQFVTQLPRRIASWFSNAVGRIEGFAGQALASAGVVGSSAITGVIQFVSQIPQKVYNEFIKIGQKIHDSVSSAVSAATSFGSDIVNAVMSALHIASPGIIQRKIALEFANIPGRILESSSSAYNAAAHFGKQIVQGFGNPKLGFDSSLINTNSTLKMGYDANTIQNLKNPSITHQYKPGTDVKSVNINVGDGAVQLDARNLTTKESQQVMIQAMEGFKSIKDVTV